VTPPLLRLTAVAKSYGTVAAVHPLDLTVEAGDFCAILGPSGCGKSTLLRMIAGFAEPSAGRIEIEGRDVTRLSPADRPTNMVFQGYGLFPHLTVRQNVAFGLRLQRLPEAEIARRVAEALALVRMEGLADRSVTAISGGQAQRVALARALILRPRILLLDEPLAALDLKLRHQMQDELRRIHRETGGTFVFVTHDQGEAFALANRILVMNAGRVEQAGTPREVYRHPATGFVARFVGETTALRGTAAAGRVTLAAGPAFPADIPDGPVEALIRPEALTLGAGLPATVIDTVFLGASLRVVAAAATGEAVIAHLPPDTAGLSPGTAVSFAWAPEAARIMPGAEA
jgi:ABC-type Fe3+/spermidine/putrescine transport system ATPase subunit